MYQLELKNITMDYGNGIDIISDFSIQVKKAEIFTLLGPSGCGKSTILRLISGLETPNSGEILLDGKHLFNKTINLDPVIRKIGFVFQDYALFPHLNIFDNIIFSINHLEKKLQRKKAQGLLELVDLEGYDKRYPHELSGGQQQRVALARALANEPSLLLLDEPFSNLDTNLREKMRTDIYNIIKETGTTAIFVTHDQSEALSLSDKIAFMENGKAKQVGTPWELYWQSSTPSVASFMGKTNFIKSSIDENGIEPYFDFKINDKSYYSTSATICIRPELIMITKKGKYSAKVNSISFIGSIIELHLLYLTSDNKKLILKAFAKPFDEFEINQNINFDIDNNGLILI